MPSRSTAVARRRRAAAGRGSCPLALRAGLVPGRLDALPCLAYAHAETGESARIRRAGVADLVPGPRVRVERRHDATADHLPGGGAIDLIPYSALELACGQAAAHLDLLVALELGVASCLVP